MLKYYKEIEGSSVHRIFLPSRKCWIKVKQYKIFYQLNLGLQLMRHKMPLKTWLMFLFLNFDLYCLQMVIYWMDYFHVKIL